LLLAVGDGPIAAGFANNVELLQQGTLVPALTNAQNLSITVEGDEVHLRTRNTQSQ
jgi:hypothetical protein